MFYFAFGFVACFALSALLVFLIPAKAVKFAAKLGAKLSDKIGEDNVERLRKIADLL
jgi:hypothetical protein